MGRTQRRPSGGTTAYRGFPVSDAPLGPDWWRAGDGKWYPAPPGLTDATTARPPTPPPDHDPVPPVARSTPFSAGVYRAGRLGAPATEPTPTRRRRGIVGIVAAVLAVIVLVVGAAALVADRSSGRASSNDPTYQQAVVDLLGSERTNIVFLQTFWESHRSHLSGGPGARSGATAGSQDIDAGWIEDMQAQVDQFAIDLMVIDDSLEDRPWPDGSVADEIRDLARSHYRTWYRWTDEIPDIARQWVSSQSSLALQDFIERTAPELGAAIDRTFRALCAALTETAPSDGRFDLTIADICPG